MKEGERERLKGRRGEGDKDRLETVLLCCLQSVETWQIILLIC